MAPGETVAIIVVLANFDVKQSFKIRVNFEARYGTCEDPPFPLSRARIHSFNARRLLLISEDSVLRCRLCDFVSVPLSDPAKSTRESLPLRRLEDLERKII